jgi:hypothetical protein
VDSEFKASLGYTVKLCFKKLNKIKQEEATYAYYTEIWKHISKEDFVTRIFKE